MNLNQEIATKFYRSFQAKDDSGMAECYSDQIVFSDPVFPHLTGDDAKAMWRMLCKTGKDLKIEFVPLDAGPTKPNEVKMRWDARYSFSKTGRFVHNVVTATMTIENGKIVRHIDDFSFWHWSRQALGPVGAIFGWSRFLQNAVRRTAAQSLARFKASSN